MSALQDIDECTTKRHITIATGVDAQPHIQKLVDELRNKWHNLKCNVIAIENEFFGKTITVAGLVTGGDLINQLKDVDLGERLILPSCMLRHEQDKFLDDVTLEELKHELNINVSLVENDGYELLNVLIGEK